jgi:hypothetical protein
MVTSCTGEKVLLRSVGQNGYMASVTAVVVSEEAPELGADYILEYCMDAEEDRKTFGQWLDRMKHATEKATEV